MAYCEHCGAYIPDGQAKCLACGFDPAAEQQRAAAAQATAYAYQQAAAEREEDTRAEVERRRAERQESDRRWAESESRRRRMEEEFRRAQEEKERRAESYVHRDDSQRVSVNIGGRRYTFGAEDASEEDQTEWRQGVIRTANRGLAAISYLGVLVFVPLLVGQDDKFVKFHARQGLKLLCYSALGSILGSFLGIGWIATLLGVGLSIKGVIDAVNGKMEELPILRKLKWF